MPETDNSQPDFSMLLASSVHDIKNSLGMLLNSLEETISDIPTSDDPQYKHFSVLQREASRINNSLVSLLGLYRLQRDQLSLSLQEHYFEDFLEEQIAAHQLLFDVHHLECILECDEDFSGFFDYNLVSGIVSNALTNAAKYTKQRVTVSAYEEGNYHIIEIRDDGDGFPDSILNCIDNSNRSVDFNSGSTNLGLFFACEIAALHKCKGNSGYIELSNHPEGGGCFKVFIP